MIKAIITDIEGTTTSLSFVKDGLFPYARAKLPDYVKAHSHEEPIRQLLAETCKEAGIEFNVEQSVNRLVEWMDQDKKITPLKALQGLIWQDGYDKGELKSHVYPDAAEQLKAWKQLGISLYVYSSGSILAQKLLFGHTEFGDLTTLFSGYFDTTIGNKKEPGSYRKIIEVIEIPAEEVLFLSDIKEELDAAKAVGYQTLWLTRDQPAQDGQAHRQVNNFTEIDLNTLPLVISPS